MFILGGIEYRGRFSKTDSKRSSEILQDRTGFAKRNASDTGYSAKH
jgi:hypothetical protein